MHPSLSHARAKIELNTGSFIAAQRVFISFSSLPSLSPYLSISLLYLYGLRFHDVAGTTIPILLSHIIYEKINDDSKAVF